MGSAISRTSSGSSRLTVPVEHRRPMVRRAISSFLACGAASLPLEKEDYPNEMLVNVTEDGHQKKFKSPRKNSSRPLGNGRDLISFDTESMVSSGRPVPTNENHAPNAGHDNKEQRLSENRLSVPPYKSNNNSRSSDTASTSYVNHQSPYTTNEMSDMDSTNGVNCNINGLNNSSTAGSPCHGETLLDAVSVENNVSDEVDASNSGLSSSSFFSGSPFDYQLLREDSLQEVTPLGFVVSEMEQNQQDGNLLQVDVVSLSSNVLPTNATEISTQEAGRSSRRLFWNAFSRHGSRNQHTELRISALSPGDSGLSSHDGLRDFSGQHHNDEIGGNSRSHENRTPGNNCSSRPEISERFRGTVDSPHDHTAVCPRGIHGNASCSCSSSSVEESGTRVGISRIVMLAEALFEVLDQLHQQPASLPVSAVSLPAPESVVDSFPLKNHSKAENLESAEDVSQCYICLAEYEEGDKIRALPCHHEFHMTCVDKWLKEIQGVCPLCRGDVSEGST